MMGLLALVLMEQKRDSQVVKELTEGDMTALFVAWSVVCLLIIAIGAVVLATR